MCTLTFTAASQTVIKVAQWWLTAGPTHAGLLLPLLTVVSVSGAAAESSCCPGGRHNFLLSGSSRTSVRAGWVKCDLSFFTLPTTPGDGLCQIKGSVDVDRNHCPPSPCTWLCYPAAVMMMIKKAAASKQPEGILKGGGWGWGADYPGSLLNIKEGWVKLIAQPRCLLRRSYYRVFIGGRRIIY